MKTSGIMLQSLILPCSCRCRYCLLSWDGKTIGCSYERSEKYAKAFHDWIVKSHPEMRFNFSFGYSMEHPDLLRAVDFMNAIGSVSGKFLQMNGLRFRSDTENERLLKDLLAHGASALNFTFYGSEAYHDRFSGRTGDFRHNLSLAQKACAIGFSVTGGIPVTKENYLQVDNLYTLLEKHGISSIRLFIPHEEGRGATLAASRLTLQEYERLGDKAKAHFNRRLYRTEAEWMKAADLTPEENRSLLISLTPENIGYFEKIGFEETIRYVESLDDAYYRAVPMFSELLSRYGDPDSQSLYGKRDLYQHYQKLYLAENHMEVYDVTDERQCGSRRF